MNKLTKFFGLLAMSLVIAFAGGWVFSLLWKWFMVPLGLSVLSIPQAMGVSLTIYFATSGYNKDRLEPEEFITHELSKYLAALIVGFLIKMLC